MTRTGVDPFSTAERSAVMRKVPAKGSSAEVKVREALTALGHRYRLHRKDLPGSPDIVMPGRKLALFVHGCFWHGHDCKRGDRPPKANADYWTAKIARNRARDTRVQTELRDMGWRAEVVWECELKNTEALKSRLSALVSNPNPLIPADPKGGVSQPGTQGLQPCATLDRPGSPRSRG